MRLAKSNKTRSCILLCFVSTRAAPLLAGLCPPLQQVESIYSPLEQHNSRRLFFDWPFLGVRGSSGRRWRSWWSIPSRLACSRRSRSFLCSLCERTRGGHRALRVLFRSKSLRSIKYLFTAFYYHFNALMNTI